MLIAFSVENYRSFKDEARLSMVAADLVSKPAELDTNNVFAATDKINLLTSAAAYGANASGKSNLVGAIALMKQLVLNSSRESRMGDPLDVQPFLLNTGTRAKPTRIEIVFVHQKTVYRYGFAITRDVVEQEWLHATLTKQESYLFERDKDTIKINAKRFKEGLHLEARTRKNALFLSVVAQFNGPVAVKLMKWFLALRVNPAIDASIVNSRYVPQRFLRTEFREEIVALVRQFDLGIDDVQVEDSPEEYVVRKRRDGTEERRLMRTGSSSVVTTHHKVFDSEGNAAGTEIFELINHESQGTQRLFTLAEPVLLALHHGAPLIIDEIDARLHPLLTIALIRLFNSPETNPRHAQLIFTTHDTNLLSADLLRRDQIWFVEKSSRGESVLYSLAEFRVNGGPVRNDAAYEKNYIQGRYGAIPFIGDLSAILRKPEPQAATEAIEFDEEVDE